MPKLIRLYITNVAIGFGLAVIFVAMLVAFDIANLRHLTGCLHIDLCGLLRTILASFETRHGRTVDQGIELNGPQVILNLSGALQVHCLVVVGHDMKSFRSRS